MSKPYRVDTFFRPYMFILGDKVKKSLVEAFKIEKKDIITIVGSGGKTSLMMEMAKELKKLGSVLITTSTKIAIPNRDQADIIFESFNDYKKVEDDNIVVALGERMEGKRKYSSIRKDQLEEIKNDFDYILIEGDGCRNLPLKMWKDHEPVIYPQTTKTIGVFPIKVLGRKIEEDFIYNFKGFKKLIKNDRVDKNTFLYLITYPKGPFKDFPLEKFIFINQVDQAEEEKKARDLVTFLEEKTRDIKYIYGSILGGNYYEN